MVCLQDEEMIRLAFRALDKDGTITISAHIYTYLHISTHIYAYLRISTHYQGNGTVCTREFKHLMTHIGDPLSEAEAAWLIGQVASTYTYNG